MPGTPTSVRSCGVRAWRLTLGLDGVRLSVIDDLPRRAVRRLVRKDPVGRRGALQASRRVDDVAGGHSLSRLGASVQPDERLAGRNGGSHLDVVLVDRPVAYRKAGADCALGVVLVCDRGAEKGHHRVADELLHGPAVAFELRAEALVVRGEQRLHVLGVELVGTLGEADEVAEDHRDDLSLAA